MRVWRASSGKFDTSRSLTKHLPTVPAAVPIYARGRTSLLALDFDAKHHTPEQVDADVERVLGWLHECGARTVTDRSTSGGRHVLVPMATDLPLRVDDIKMVMQLLSARLVTLDATPMLNADWGCITPRARRAARAATASSMGPWMRRSMPSPFAPTVASWLV